MTAVAAKSGRSGGAALGVPAFRDLLDDLGRERLEIAGISRGDHPLVDDDLRVLPFGAGVDHVGLDRVVGGRLAALDDASLYQEPGCVADRGDDLLLVEEG